MFVKFFPLLLVIALSVSGCTTIRTWLFGDPSANLRSAETRWLLIKNPRFGDVPSEPEFVWVEENKRPWTTRWGVPQRAPLATPEIVAQYGSPPGGGRISPQQAVPYQVNAPAPDRRATAAARPPATAAATTTPRAPSSAQPPPAPETKRGYVVWADTTRIVIDLTADDGVRTGAVVSLRRDRIPIVHPVTGEVLGELDEEVATARVTELREKFSVAEIQTVAPGAQIQVRDRVVPK